MARSGGFLQRFVDEPVVRDENSRDEKRDVDPCLEEAQASSPVRTHGRKHTDADAEDVVSGLPPRMPLERRGAQVGTEIFV